MQVNLSGINLEIPRATPLPIRNWMLGQLLDASVIGRDGENSIRLKVGGTEVRAATALPLQKGENLTLRVTQLRPVVTLTPARAAESPEAERVRAAINQALPRQRPLLPLLERLSAISTQSPSRPGEVATAGRLPGAIAEAAQRILQTIPSFSEVSDAKRLPAAVHRLGLFAESTVQHRLTRSEATLPERDLKWQLLRLRGLVRGTANQAAATGQRPEQATGQQQPAAKAPTRIASAPVGGGTKPITAAEPRVDVESVRVLSQLVDGAIAKIESNQLKAVSALLDGEYQLTLDLPIALEDSHKVIQLKVSREAGEQRSGESTSASTVVVIEIPVTEGAALRAVVTLNAENVTVKLWSEDAELRRTIALQRDMLADRLRNNGLDTVNISIVELKPFDEWGKKFEKLVDVKA
jgi:hypothetical protein